MTVLIATRHQLVYVDGVAHRIRMGQTADSESPVVAECDDDVWQEYQVDYPAEMPAGDDAVPADDETPGGDDSTARPPVNASKAEWQAYGLTLGLTDEYVNEATKADLIAHIDELEADKGE
jgi:hypothetical protein